VLSTIYPKKSTRVSSAAKRRTSSPQLDSTLWRRGQRETRKTFSEKQPRASGLVLLPTPPYSSPVDGGVQLEGLRPGCARLSFWPALDCRYAGRGEGPSSTGRGERAQTRGGDGRGERNDSVETWAGGSLLGNSWGHGHCCRRRLERAQPKTPTSERDLLKEEEEEEERLPPYPLSRERVVTVATSRAPKLFAPFSGV